MHLRIVIVLFTLTGNVFAQAESCHIAGLPVIHFYKTVFLSKKAKLLLDSVVRIAELKPLCKIKVTGYGPATEEEQQYSRDKVASVIMYLKKKCIPKSKFLLDYGGDGDPKTVDISGTTEDGPQWVPKPHPTVSYHQPASKRSKHLIH